jgi:hypothetical protein
MHARWFCCHVLSCLKVVWTILNESRFVIVHAGIQKTGNLDPAFTGVTTSFSV